MTTKEKFYITTPLYYVNDIPHIGSAYTTIACDAIIRFYKLRGYDTCLLTGTDEHGQKIEKSAKANEKTPREHTDLISAEFKKLWELLNIEYSKFSRTSSEKHAKIVKEFFKRVYDNGDIYESDYEGLYCEACEDFYKEEDLLEDNLCPTHKTKVSEYKEKNYFFALSKYQDRLLDYINKNPKFIQPEFRKNEVMGWINEGLKDFPISRRSVKWGIPLPIDEDQTIYVWFDALLGYISGLFDDSEDISLEGALEKYWPCNCHVIGKDILRFHAVYWPCMLMSAGLPLPGKVFGHGFLTKDGEKMGKTTGNIIDPIELINSYGEDAVRFFFLKEVYFGKDGDFTKENFINRINSDLANNLGNLLNRSLNLVNKNFDGEIGSTGDEYSSLKDETNKTIDEFTSLMIDFKLKEALECLWLLIDKTNKSFNDNAPWKLLKEGKTKEAQMCLYETLEVLRNITIMIYPFIPKTSQSMFNQLGYDRLEDVLGWDKLGFCSKNPLFKVNIGKPVFPRIE